MPKAKQLKSRTFQYVMFWDEVAWVAGPVDYYYVTQGPTPEECVERLREGLWLTAVWSEKEGHELFSDTDANGPHQVPDEFKAVDEACTFDDECSANKEKSYTGSVTIEWEVPEKPKTFFLNEQHATKARKRKK